MTFKDSLARIGIKGRERLAEVKGRFRPPAPSVDARPARLLEVFELSERLQVLVREREKRGGIREPLRLAVRVLASQRRFPEDELVKTLDARRGWFGAFYELVRLGDRHGIWDRVQIRQGGEGYAGMLWQAMQVEQPQLTLAMDMAEYIGENGASSYREAIHLVEGWLGLRNGAADQVPDVADVAEREDIEHNRPRDRRRAPITSGPDRGPDGGRSDAARGDRPARVDVVDLQEELPGSAAMAELLDKARRLSAPAEKDEPAARTQATQGAALKAPPRGAERAPLIDALVKLNVNQWRDPEEQRETDGWYDGRQLYLKRLSVGSELLEILKDGGLVLEQVAKIVAGERGTFTIQAGQSKWRDTYAIDVRALRRSAGMAAMAELDRTWRGGNAVEYQPLQVLGSTGPRRRAPRQDREPADEAPSPGAPPRDERPPESSSAVAPGEAPARKDVGAAADAPAPPAKVAEDAAAAPKEGSGPRPGPESPAIARLRALVRGEGPVAAPEPKDRTEEKEQEVGR